MHLVNLTFFRISMTYCSTVFMNTYYRIQNIKYKIRMLGFDAVKFHLYR